MPKQLMFNEEARAALLRGINTMSHAVKVTLGPRGRNVVIGKKFGQSHPDQGRRHRRQGDRAQGPLRKHGGADAQGSRLQDLRHRG